jgi:hypothetical protein
MLFGCLAVDNARSLMASLQRTCPGCIGVCKGDLPRGTDISHYRSLLDRFWEFLGSSGRMRLVPPCEYSFCSHACEVMQPCPPVMYSTWKLPPQNLPSLPGRWEH